MDKSTLISIINSYRTNFNDNIPETKKGMRFYNNDRVISRLKSTYITSNDDTDFDFTGKFLDDNIPGILSDLSFEDWHFSSKEKWGIE